MEESYIKTGHELIEYGGLMEESYVKTGHELIEYWTRNLSVAIKDRLHQQHFVESVRGAVKNEELVLNELDLYQCL